MAVASGHLWIRVGRTQILLGVRTQNQAASYLSLLICQSSVTFAALASPCRRYANKKCHEGATRGCPPQINVNVDT